MYTTVQIGRKSSKFCSRSNWKKLKLRTGKSDRFWIFNFSESGALIWTNLKIYVPRARAWLALVFWCWEGEEEHGWNFMEFTRKIFTGTYLKIYNFLEPCTKIPAVIKNTYNLTSLSLIEFTKWKNGAVFCVTVLDYNDKVISTYHVKQFIFKNYYNYLFIAWRAPTQLPWGGGLT